MLKINFLIIYSNATTFRDPNEFFVQYIKALDNNERLKTEELMYIGSLVQKSIQSFDVSAHLENHRFSKGYWINIPRGVLLRNIDDNTAEVFMSSELNERANWLHYGTRMHFVAPVKAKALSWVQDGVRRFSKGHNVKGIQAFNFFTADNEELKSNISKYLSSIFKSKAENSSA